MSRSSEKSVGIPCLREWKRGVVEKALIAPCFSILVATEVIRCGCYGYVLCSEWSLEVMLSETMN